MRLFASLAGSNQGLRFAHGFPAFPLRGRAVVAALSVAVALMVSGCGAATDSTVSDQPVTILVQPVGQVVPISQTATFTVTASGTGPLSYQWSENGRSIAGATAASYTTPAIALGASASPTVGTFQVVVSNASSSASSNPVTLSAGPRSPKPGDVRYLSFQQVSLPGFLSTYGGGAHVLNSGEWSFANTLGTPLAIGNWVTAGPCGWDFAYYPLPPSMNNMAMYYQEGFLQYTTAPAYLQSVAASYLVITSLDIQPQVGCQAIGVSWIETAQGGFDQRLEVVTPAQLQAQVAQDGQASRIVTAASFDGSGNIDVLSYGWTGDTTTVYETQTNFVTPAQVGPTATSLAANGYFVSAFGGNDSTGYVLIGARVKGDTLPRAMNVNGIAAPNPDSAYFTPVIYFIETGGTNSVTAWEQ
jgi:hypothetical protein